MSYLFLFKDFGVWFIISSGSYYVVLKVLRPINCPYLVTTFKGMNA